MKVTVALLGRKSSNRLWARNVGTNVMGCTAIPIIEIYISLGVNLMRNMRLFVMSAAKAGMILR